MNNSNFGNDCRNNLDNCKLEPLYNGLDGIRYIKQFCNILNHKQFAEFFSFDLLTKQVENKHKKRIENLNEDDELYFIIKEQLERTHDEEIELIEMYKKKTDESGVI